MNLNTPEVETTMHKQSRVTSTKAIPYHFHRLLTTSPAASSSGDVIGTTDFPRCLPRATIFLVLWMIQCPNLPRALNVPPVCLQVSDSVTTITSPEASLRRDMAKAISLPLMSYCSLMLLTFIPTLF